MTPAQQSVPTAPTSLFPIGLAPQTGMPPIYSSRSRELLYDTLMFEPHFIFNPFGPQTLAAARKEHRW